MTAGVQPGAPASALDGIVVIIPSLHPSEHLLETVRAVRAEGLHSVVVVDDGSGPDYAHHFAAVDALDGCTVLRHPVNRGKGAALKTAFAHCLEDDAMRGVVTADADGQHRPEDVLAVATAVAGHLVERDEHVCVLGARDFDLPDLPARSRLGNRLTTGVVQALFGQSFPDTQTGLRGFSRDLLDDLLEVRGTRFEYEMNVLMHLLTYHVPIHQVPIETVYHDVDNSQSHFRPVRDSALVYGGILRQFVRFALSSGLGAVVDLLAFVAIIDGAFSGSAELTAVAVATVGARTVSALTNYLVNRHLVFDARRPVRQSLPRYVGLAVLVLGLSALATSGLGQFWGGHVVWAKVVVDTILFVLSYLVQKRWVFAPRLEDRGGT